MCMQIILRLGGVEPLDIQDEVDESPNSFGLVQSPEAESSGIPSLP